MVTTSVSVEGRLCRPGQESGRHGSAQHLKPRSAAASCRSSASGGAKGGLPYVHLSSLWSLVRYDPPRVRQVPPWHASSHSRTLPERSKTSKPVALHELTDP